MSTSPPVIKCESCDRTWKVAAPLSLYEQQALETRPCPACGAYTLACQREGEVEIEPIIFCWRPATRRLGA